MVDGGNGSVDCRCGLGSSVVGSVTNATCKKPPSTGGLGRTFTRSARRKNLQELRLAFVDNGRAIRSELGLLNWQRPSSVR